MASIYASLHVRESSGKAAPVNKIVEQLHDFAAERGIKLQAAELDSLPDPAEQPGRLGLVVFGGSDGWRSLMASDPALLSPLAAHLSRASGGSALVTRAIHGDAWGYELFERGEKASDFDSQQFRAQQRELPNAAPPVVVPPDILNLASRMRQAQASEQEVQQLADYMAASPEGAAVIAASAMSEALGIPLEQALSMFPAESSESALTPNRLAALQPYLIDGNGVDELREVLDDDSPVPDATLSNFLPLVGLSPAYGGLEYELVFVEHWYDPEDVLPEDVQVAKVLLGEQG